ncbi:MAG: rhodanese-like domain-containing protein [Deltaproteobacteria bacterium]|nr:rhodanese-like domain-containing protein [Deltaproteobacteria bacterium]
MRILAWRWWAVTIGMTLCLGASGGCGGLSPEERAAQECRETSTEAHRYVDEGGVLLDVRPVSAFTQEHITDAVNMPVEDIEERMHDELERDVVLVIYDDEEDRWERAEEILRQAGYRVFVLGKMSTWFC